MNKKIVSIFILVFVFVCFVFAQSNVSELNATYNEEMNNNYSLLNNAHSNYTYESNGTIYSGVNYSSLVNETVYEVNGTGSIVVSISEEVTCVFANSEEVQKCYTLDNRAYCDSTVEQYFCSMNVSGNEGEELAWMSSCSSYNTTFIDGIDEEITFDCSISSEQDSGFGYAYAEYQCYDDPGYSNFVQVPSDFSCQSYDSWKKIAEELCKDKCGLAQVNVAKGVYENQTLCGLKAFGISQQCHQGLFSKFFNWFKKLFGVYYILLI